MKFNLKKLRKDQWVILFLAGILLIVIVLPTGGKKSDGQSEKNSEIISETTVQGAGGSGKSGSADKYAEALEQRLEEVLGDMEGVGDVTVMITLKDQGESVVEKDLTSSDSSTQESDASGIDRKVTEHSSQQQTVFSQEDSSSETPFVTKELQPEIEGVLVVAQGGGSSVVVKNISEAVQALFGLEAHKIKIVKMN